VHEGKGGGLADDTDVDPHRRIQKGQKSNTVGRRADKNTNKRWWVRRTGGQQRRDRQAPRRPETAPAEDDDASDDGCGCSMWGGWGTADRRIDARGRGVYLRSMACHKFNLQLLWKLTSQRQDRPLHRQQ